MDWSLAASENVDGDPVVTLELKDGPYSRSMWDFGFHALFKVTNCFAYGIVWVAFVTYGDLSRNIWMHLHIVVYVQF